MNVENLKLLSKVLAIIRLITIPIFIFLSLILFTQIRYSVRSSEYKKGVYIIDSIYTISDGNGGSYWRTKGHLKASNEKKVYYEIPLSSRKTIKVGKEITVWNIPRLKTVIYRDRDRDENKFNTKKYYNRITFICLFGILPIIALWYAKHKINLKIRFNENN